MKTAFDEYHHLRQFESSLDHRRHAPLRKGTDLSQAFAHISQASAHFRHKGHFHLLVHEAGPGQFSFINRDAKNGLFACFLVSRKQISQRQFMCLQNELQRMHHIC